MLSEELRKCAQESVEGMKFDSKYLGSRVYAALLTYGEKCYAAGTAEERKRIAMLVNAYVPCNDIAPKSRLLDVIWGVSNKTGEGK